MDDRGAAVMAGIVDLDEYERVRRSDPMKAADWDRQGRLTLRLRGRDELIERQNAEIKRLRDESKRLKRLLAVRDDFLVARGLFNEFALQVGIAGQMNEEKK